MEVEQLRKLYLKTSSPGSLGGVNRFYREVKKNHPNITRKQIKEFLKTQSPYTLHKRPNKIKKYRKTLVYKPRDLFQIDLLDFQRHANENSGYKYLCVIIDCFSKFVWVKPLKSKHGKSVVKALSLLLTDTKPTFIQADQGTEFFNKDVAKMLEAFGSKLYHTYSEKKAAIVERVQRTLRQRLGRLFTANEDYNWINHIDDVVSSYNNSYHRTIGMAPAKVTEADIERICKRMFGTFDVLKPKFQVGEAVRLLVYKAKFDKESHNTWTSEIFRIKTIKHSSPVTYLIEDLEGEDITGSFYAEELQHVA